MTRREPEPVSAGLISRLREADETPSFVRPSVTLATAAAALAANKVTIRRMLAAGELTGHRLRTRGLRIYADSIDAYRAAHALGGRRASTTPKLKVVPSAPFRAVLAGLQEMGLLIQNEGKPPRKRRRHDRLFR